MRFFLLWLLVSSCTTIQYPSPLAQKILKPREGYKGLTNRTCLEYRLGDCKKASVDVYNLEDESIRKQLNDYKFVCNVGGKRYKICLDRPGLCNITYTKKCFLFICSKGDMVVTYLPQEPVKGLLEAGVECRSEAYE